jgi:hypothetical protein
MITSYNTTRLGENELVVDIEYKEQARYYNGGSSIRIKTKGNGRVDSVVIREYDEKGQLVSSQAYYA